MSIQVKYFASLRDRLGRAEDQVDGVQALTITELWQRLWPDMPMPVNTLAAVNLEYQALDYTVQDGDEVAFFPPVTGG